MYVCELMHMASFVDKNKHVIKLPYILPSKFILQMKFFCPPLTSTPTDIIPFLL